MNIQEDKISELLSCHHASSGITGTIALFKDDDLGFSISCADAGRPFHTILGAHTAYGLASAAKLFTAIAALLLIQQRKLALDTSVRDIFGDAFPYLSAEMTIHQLIIHTSGISEYFNDCEPQGFESVWKSTPTYRVREPKDFISLIQTCSTSPRQQGLFKYRNSGYVALGLIVEAVSGQSFYRFVEGNIFESADMTDSGYFHVDMLPNHATVGYLKDGSGRWKSNLFSIPARGGGEGGAYCSPRDMHRLWRAILGGKLLDAPTRQKFLSPQVQDGSDGEWFYSFGYWINQVGNEVIKYTCVGEDPGCSVRYFYYPRNDSALSVFTNVSDGAGKLSVDLQNMLWGSFNQKACEPETLNTCTTALSSCSTQRVCVENVE
ncbi:MAG: beta-lactamase family protein [Planctomycetes bacterium]|nr:beta-lactamase family protein [Planctomycetota bacterium]